MEEYKYRAFISYSHMDKKIVAYMQKVLETFRLPRDYKKGTGLDIQYIDSMFRDETDLVGYRLTPSLKTALDQSEYLLVFCTPNSACSKWVNLEISYFIETGRIDNIIPIKYIPLIPFRKGKEVYPQALQTLLDNGELSREDILTFSLRDNTFLGKENLLEIINKLYGFGKQTYVHEFKKKREIINLYKSIVAFAICVFLVVESYNALEKLFWPLITYDSIYLDSNMHIKGKGKRTIFTAGEEYYQLKSISQINHAFFIEVRHICPSNKKFEIPGSYLWDADIMELHYDLGVRNGISTMRLSKVILKDENENVRMVKNYALVYPVVDLSLNDTSSDPFFLPDDYTIGFMDSSVQYKEDLFSSCRIVEKYDENMWLNEIWFLQDSSSIMVPDKHGYYAILYNRNEDGEIISVSYLNQNGDIMEEVKID